MIDDRYLRRVSKRTETPPSAADWAEHKRARALLEELECSPYYDPGCSCERPSIETPRARIEYEYAETEAEWIERCHKLSQHTGESFIRAQP